MNANDKKYISLSTLYATALLLMSGSIIQSFMLENGISESRVAIYLSVVQIIQVSLMFGVSLIIDKIKNVIKAFALTMLWQVVLFGALIFLCIFTKTQITLKYFIIFAAGIIANIALSGYNTISYKAPYHIIELIQFGKVTGILGVISGILGIVISTALSFFTAKFNYNTVMLLFFVFGTILLISAYIVTLTVKPIEYKHNTVKKRINLFKYKPFTILIIPNILRGIATGILLVSMTMGYSLGITNKSSGAVLTLLLQVATVLSCLIYIFIQRRRNDGKIIIISSVLLVISMPMMFINKSLGIFYTVYFASNFIINFINNAVPTAVTKFVDYEYIGQYSTWRMLLHTLGVAIASALITPILKVFGGTGTMVIAASLQLISGIVYWIFLNKCKYVDE